MATVSETIQKIIQHTAAKPPRILWHRYVCSETTFIINEKYAAEPLTNSVEWNSMLLMKQQNIVPGSFSAKVVVASQHIETLVDNTVDNNLSILMHVADPPFKITKGVINHDEGILEFQWDSFRQNHEVLLTYEYKKTDCNIGDVGVIYHTGNTPWRPDDSWPWGVALSLTKKSDRSVLKSKRFMLYEDRIPTYILEPEAGSTDEANINNLFKEIELKVLDPFKYYLDDLPAPASPATGALLLG